MARYAARLIEAGAVPLRRERRVAWRREQRRDAFAHRQPPQRADRAERGEAEAAREIDRRAIGEQRAIESRRPRPRGTATSAARERA